MEIKVKIISISKEANGLQFNIPCENAILFEQFGKQYIRFPDGTAIPESWLDYTMVLDSAYKKVNVLSSLREHKMYKAFVNYFSRYTFDIKGYAKAILMIIVLCLPFFYFGGLDWKQAPYPAMAVFLFLMFFQKKEEN